MEFTDSWFKNDPRRGGPAPKQTGGVVGGVDVAWVTAVVRDAGATAELLAEIAGAATVAGNARRDASIEDTRDVLGGVRAGMGPDRSDVPRRRRRARAL